jgi:hypothetical protein
VLDRVFDFFADVVGRVVLQADDGRALHANAVLAQHVRKLVRVRVLELVVIRARGFQSHPDPGDAELHQFLRRVLADRVRRGEHCHAPGFVAFLHAIEQAHGALFVEQEIFVHDEERLHAKRLLGMAEHVVELVAGLIEVHELALAAKERRRGAEVAAHGAAH